MTLPSLIGLSGYARAGKDTVAGILAERGYERVAFADALRDALYALNPVVTISYQVRDGIRHSAAHKRVSAVVDALGWDKAKTDYPEIRDLLQRLGTEVGRIQWGDDFWVQIAMRKAINFPLTVITDVRFPSEAASIKKHRGEVWRINRPGTDPVNGHSSETALDNYTFDRYIDNDATIEALRDLVLDQ